MNLEFQVSAKIEKPVSEVFDGVYNPEKLSKYFTTGGASAALIEGTTVTWEFADYPGAFPVTVKKNKTNSLIIFEWPSMEGDHNNTVEIRFESLDPGFTKVTVKESGWHEDQKGLDASYENCQGWMQMLCSLKVYLEYGINLRKDFF